MIGAGLRATLTTATAPTNTSSASPRSASLRNAAAGVDRPPDAGSAPAAATGRLASRGADTAVCETGPGTRARRCATRAGFAAGGAAGCKRAGRERIGSRGCGVGFVATARGGAATRAEVSRCGDAARACLGMCVDVVTDACGRASAVTGGGAASVVAATTDSTGAVWACGAESGCGLGWTTASGTCAGSATWGCSAATTGPGTGAAAGVGVSGRGGSSPSGST